MVSNRRTTPIRFQSLSYDIYSVPCLLIVKLKAIRSLASACTLPYKGFVLEMLKAVDVHNNIILPYKKNSNHINFTIMTFQGQQLKYTFVDYLMLMK